MKIRTSRWGLSVAMVLASGGLALAADPEKAVPAEPTPEVRREMAAVHKKMAGCLESERPIAECRAEMMKSCQTMMGEGGCPMMGSMGGGMMHGPGMMHGGEPKAEPGK